MTAIDISIFTKRISDRSFERLCADNPETRFETTSQGKLIVMSPTGSESGRKNGKLFFQVELWNTRTKLGVTFDSSTGFKLSNGAIRSPDVSWVNNDQYKDEKQVEIYRNGQDKEVLNNPQTLSGENILPNLIVDLTEIFDC